jgi:hypothetical protein
MGFSGQHTYLPAHGWQSCVLVIGPGNCPKREWVIFPGCHKGKMAEESHNNWAINGDKLNLSLAFE